MSNRVNLNAVKMEYLDGTIAYGYTISDDYEMSFDNNAEAMIEDDLELLKYVKETADEPTQAMLSFLEEEEKGISINDNWYDYEQIEKILKGE